MKEQSREMVSDGMIDSEDPDAHRAFGRVLSRMMEAVGDE